MTEEERFNRENLLRRAAAAAGAVYVAPVLSSAAAAAAEGGCDSRICARRKKKWRQKHRPRCQQSGVGCDCLPGGRCVSAHCPCQRQNPDPCGPIEPCGEYCGCYLAAKGGTPVCIELREVCDAYEPCDADLNCPPGQVCFRDCCQEFGYPPLCAECCSG
jgi:hypothetical protein